MGMGRSSVYDEYAAEYAQLVAEREAHLAGDPLLAPTLDLLGDVTGLRVLDAACGEGFLARILAARGAAVTGIDLAPRLIALARARGAAAPITYRVADLSAPQPDLVGQFDRVVSYLALNDVAGYQGFSATLAAALTPGGRLVIAMNNPYSYIVRNHVRDYFDSGTAYSYRGMAAQGVKVHFYQRTLEDYLTAFLATGLRLERLVDVPTPEAMLSRPPPLAPLLPPGYQFPYFMILSFVRP
jgi:2-polyprenyl-3-methyl-5-hydroxy-6-metoxy-1,4-benzoquinol methylase